MVEYYRHLSTRLAITSYLVYKFRSGYFQLPVTLSMKKSNEIGRITNGTWLSHSLAFCYNT